MIILCPFDLKRVFRGNFDAFYAEFIEKIVINRFLKGPATGIETKAASILLASLLKRPSESAELEKFLDWSIENTKGGGEFSIGILLTLVQLGKVSDDAVGMAHYQKMNQISQIIAETSSSNSVTSNKLILKLRARLTQIQAKLGIPIQLNSFISALKDRDTVIRWTAAKALRRIMKICSNSTKVSVFNTILSQLDYEFKAPFEASPHTLHGSFLAIGQFLNYRLIDQVSDDHRHILIKVLIDGLKFDQIKGSYAVGSFVRDAACYVTWAFARYCNQLINPKDDHKIIAGLTCMALFDREVAGRRAASAALQEFIGRIGGDRQGPYLQILSHVHFFSVAALEKSFRSNALEIAKDIPQIIPDLINHLLKVSLFNFDQNVRKLAAETLGDFYVWDKENLANKLIQIHEESDDIFAIHGALLSMAALPCSPVARIVEISLQSDRIPVKSLGADLLLEGYLILISSVSVKAEISDDHVAVWLQAITIGLKSRSDNLRKTAISALQSISAKYGHLLDNFYLSCLTSIEKERDTNYQKGLLAALSTSSEDFFSKNGNILIKLLLKTAKTIVPINDIEKRCAAIESLYKLLCIYKESSTLIDYISVKECLVSSLLCDYSIDTRGDVGSKIRLSALKLAETFPNCPEIDDLILEQAFGRLDKLRIPAMKAIFPHGRSVEFDGFASNLLEEKEIPLKGAFRGLIFSCGGLDPEMTKISADIIKQFITKWGSGVFESVALSSVADERLCIPVLLTMTNLISYLSNKFIESFSASLVNSFIPKITNIRKLIPSFNFLIKVNKLKLIGKYSEFLDDQLMNHKFPSIRQLIQSSKCSNNE